MSVFQSLLMLAARQLLALLFIVEGVLKITNYDGALRYMDTYSVPAWLLPPAILLELGGGMMIVFGALTRLVALAFFGFCLLTAVIFHTDFSSTTELFFFLKNLSIAGGYLILLAFGPGRFSIDAWRMKTGV